MESPTLDHEELTAKFIGCAMKVHSSLGPGFLEAVYQNALSHELKKAHIKHECCRKIQVV